MSGYAPALLHVATHGFYMTEKDAEREKPRLDIMEMQTDSRPAVREDVPMTRSGLYMYGCNYALNNGVLLGNVEYGILTAQEIASLDLRGLDLVV